MDLQAAALAVQQRGGAVLLQQGVGGSRRAVLLPEGEADLRDQRLGPPQTAAGRRGTLHWRRFEGVLSVDGCVVLRFVFMLENNPF